MNNWVSCGYVGVGHNNNRGAEQNYQPTNQPTNATDWLDINLDEMRWTEEEYSQSVV